MKVILKNKLFLVLAILFSIAFLYFGAKGTYTAYESIVSGRMDNQVSEIHLKINGEELGVDDELDNSVILDNITWTSTHTREGKMSPGSTGDLSLELDATGSEVAILYTIQFVDKDVDENKFLTFDQVTCDRTIVKTAADTYSGIITLNDILNNRKVHINAHFFFDNTVDIEGFTEDDQQYEDFFEIHFQALQYQGETLVPYTG